jgi:hypothetical protein
VRIVNAQAGACALHPVRLETCVHSYGPSCATAAVAKDASITFDRSIGALK